VFKINTIENNNRMSTQDLLLAISDALAKGETEFNIEASGQHDIGGPLWHPEGKKLKFHVKNAGQRVGSMCLDNTEIIVEDSASADVGGLMPVVKLLLKAMPAILLVIVRLPVLFILVVEPELDLVR